MDLARRGSHHVAALVAGVVMLRAPVPTRVASMLAIAALVGTAACSAPSRDPSAASSSTTGIAGPVGALVVDGSDASQVTLEESSSVTTDASAGPAPSPRPSSRSPSSSTPTTATPPASGTDAAFCEAARRVFADPAVARDPSDDAAMRQLVERRGVDLDTMASAPPAAIADQVRLMVAVIRGSVDWRDDAFTSIPVVIAWVEAHCTTE
jgi:hypothetical protein